MKTHPLNVSYLVVGLAFLGISGAWALRQAGVIGSADMEWLLPLTLVVAGGIGLLAFAARGLGGRRTDGAPAYAATTYATPAYETPTDTSTYEAPDADTEPTTRIDTEGDPR